MVIPYLSFQGNCEEALNRYISAFGGRMLALSRYTAETGSSALVGKVMHAEAAVGAGVVSGSDQEQPVQHADSIRLMVHCETAAQARACCEKLAEGGQLLQRLTPHPPPDDGGMGALVRDAFGYVWIVTAPNEQRK